MFLQKIQVGHRNFPRLLHVQVMAAIEVEGFLNLSLVTDQPASEP